MTLDLVLDNIDAIVIVITGVVFFLRMRGTIEKIDTAIEKIDGTLEKLDNEHANTRKDFREEHSKTRATTWQARKDSAEEHKQMIAALVEIRTGLQAFINNVQRNK